MSQLVDESVRSGQPHNLMNMTSLMWESTTVAGIQMGMLQEFGAIPLIQGSDGSIVLSISAPQSQ